MRKIILFDFGMKNACWFVWGLEENQRATKFQRTGRNHLLLIVNFVFIRERMNHQTDMIISNTKLCFFGEKRSRFRLRNNKMEIVCKQKRTLLLRNIRFHFTRTLLSFSFQLSLFSLSFLSPFPLSPLLSSPLSFSLLYLQAAIFETANVVSRHMQTLTA